MSAWASVGSTYIEAATSAMPLHRALVFAVGLGGAVAVREQTHLSIFETLARVPLSDMTSLATGPLSKAVFADVLVGVALVVGGWVFSRLMLRAVFALAAISTNLWERAGASAARSPIDPEQPLADRQSALELIDKSLDEPRARLRSRGAAAELTASLGLGCLLAAYWGNALDGILGGALTVVAVGLQVSSVRIFLADYLGPAMLKARLLGKKPPLPTSIV